MSQNLALESAVWAEKGKQLYIYKNKFNTVPLICWIEPQIVIKPPLGFTVKFKIATIIPLQVFFLLIPHYLATNFIVGTRLFNYFWNPIKLAVHFLWKFSPCLFSFSSHNNHSSILQGPNPLDVQRRKLWNRWSIYWIGIMVSINGNTKPKTELLIKKEKKNAILTHCTLSVKVMRQELQFINLYHHS